MKLTMQVRADLADAEFSEAEVRAMSEWLRYQGIIGYTARIVEALYCIGEAAKNP